MSLWAVMSLCCTQDCILYPQLVSSLTLTLPGLYSLLVVHINQLCLRLYPVSPLSLLSPCCAHVCIPFPLLVITFTLLYPSLHPVSSPSQEFYPEITMTDILSSLFILISYAYDCTLIFITVTLLCPWLHPLSPSCYHFHLLYLRLWPAFSPSH